MRNNNNNNNNKEVSFTQRKKKKKIFGFTIGENGFAIEIMATSEKKALLLLVDKYWKTISERGSIEILGNLKSRIIN